MSESVRVLFVDNFDSFSYNVAHLLAACGGAPDVTLNDDPRLVPEVLPGYAALVIGPGPGRPQEAPQMLAVLRAAMQRRMPVLGVCLGLQAIGQVLGATVTHAPQQMHGKTSRITHDGSGLFAGLPSRCRRRAIIRSVLRGRRCPPNCRLRRTVTTASCRQSRIAVCRCSASSFIRSPY